MSPRNPSSPDSAAPSGEPPASAAENAVEDVSGRLTDRLHAAALPLWEAQVEHPFVRGIGDGSLEPERFENWVRQDYLYLKDFARLFAWAAAKADRLESMAWYAAVLDLTLNTEMDLHRTYAGRFGISPEELEAETAWPTTRAYTDFLVRVAADGDMADLLAALLPCAWGYAHVGQALAEGGLPEDDRYADWVEQYASEEFADVAEFLRRELERVAGEPSADKLRRLEELFVLSSRYELAFWEMCWGGETWNPPEREAGADSG